MKHLLSVLMLGMFVLAAPQTQASQVCEAEIQELLRYINAGGQTLNQPRTRVEAIHLIQEHSLFTCSRGENRPGRKNFIPTEEFLRKYEKEISEKYPLNTPERAKAFQSLLNERAMLAQRNLHKCAKEANNAKRCNVSPASAAHAKWSVRPIGGGWDLVTTDNGCIAYEYSVGQKREYQSITWSGNCQKGQLISGRGSLTFWLHDGHNVYYKGQFVSGFMHGNVILQLSGQEAIDNDFVMGCASFHRPSCGSTRPAAASTANPATTSRNTQPTERTSTPAAGTNPTPRPSAANRDTGSADLAPVASSPKQVPKSAAVNDCLKFNRDKDNRIAVTNVCNFTVQYSWCLKSPDRSISVFACKDPYQGEGSAGLRAGGTTSLQGSTKATGVRWIACRGTIGEVLPLLSQNGKNGCY